MTSAKTYYRRISPARQAWAESMPPMCMFCGREFGNAWPKFGTCHEIERKSAAPNRWGALCNYLLLCADPCHEIVSGWPKSKQLAMKFLRDQAHYDLQAWLKLRDPELRAPQRVTQEEVEAWL